MEHFLIDPSENRHFIDFRLLGIANVRLLGHYEAMTVLPPLELHEHGELLEICCLERGEQIYEVGGQEYHLYGGDVFVVFPGEPHSTSSKPQTRGSLYWLLITLKESNRGFLNLPKTEGKALRTALSHLPNRLFTGTPKIFSLLHEIFNKASQGNGPLLKLQIHTCLCQFLLEINSSSRERKNRSLSHAIRRICTYISEHLDETLGAAELAEVARISPSHFSKKFREEMGMSVGDFVLGEKIAKAETLLRETPATITDIAMQLSFSSSQYFATVFKRYTGKNPTEIRTISKTKSARDVS